MEENIFLFAQNGGLFVIMFIMFLIGFSMKVLVGLIYDNAIEKAIVFQDSKRSPVWNIIEKYKKQFSGNDLCKNTRAFVDNELHNWKICGIFVERFNDIGNLIVGLGIFICVIFDMILLISKTFENANSSIYMRYIYLYSMISIIMLIVIKGWEIFINIDNKKNILSDKIVNFLDNNCGYQEYAMVKTNVYIEDSYENSLYKKEGKEIELSSKTETDNIVESEKEQNSVKEIEVNNEKNDSLQKKDKEKVIEQVLEEFLV